MVALKAALPLESLEPAMCNQTVFEEGADRWEQFSRCRRAPYNRLAEHLSSQASLPQDHSICSVLAARPLACCRGMRAQRETTLLRQTSTLGAEQPGWGIQGTTFPCDQGEKGDRGGQLTRELWLCPGKNNREGPSEGLQLPTPTTTHMHFRVQRGTQYSMSLKNNVSTVRKEPKLFQSLLYN